MRGARTRRKLTSPLPPPPHPAPPPFHLQHHPSLFSLFSARTTPSSSPPSITADDLHAMLDDIQSPLHDSDAYVVPSPLDFPALLVFLRQHLPEVVDEPMWFYRDDAGDTQGPVPTEVLREWIQDKLVPGTLSVQHEEQPAGTWHPAGKDFPTSLLATLGLPARVPMAAVSEAASSAGGDVQAGDDAVDAAHPSLHRVFLDHVASQNA